jgi:hypothetical protein
MSTAVPPLNSYLTAACGCMLHLFGHAMHIVINDLLFMSCTTKKNQLLHKRCRRERERERERDRERERERETER